MKVKIIYETQNGTTQYVAEVMQKKLQSLGHQTDLHSIRYDGQNPVLEGYDVVLFGAPTYDDGKLETAMRVFITKYTADLSKYKVGVFGLGNSSYPQFCLAADFLEEWVLKNNAKLNIPTLRIDGFPDKVEFIEQWVEQFV
jgi:flavodoxin I